MPGSRLVLISFFAASFLGALALRSADLGTVPWAVSRASGLAAFAVLSLSVIMGLLISTKASDGLLSRPFVFEMHQFLAVASLALIGVHAGSLLFDGFLHFTSLSLLVPFLSPYRPVAVGAGVIAGWLVAITTASFWLRSRIGTKRWRTLHLRHIPGVLRIARPWLLRGHRHPAAAGLLGLRGLGSCRHRPHDAADLRLPKPAAEHREDQARHGGTGPANGVRCGEAARGCSSRTVFTR
jgi:hypothetical protein